MNKQPTLILLHGWGMNARVFDPITAHLAPHFNCVALNLPGHGHAADVTYNGHEASALLNHWVNALVQQIPEAYEPFYLAGWSLGGLLGLEIARQYPHRVRGLGLLASSPKFVAAENWPAIPQKNLDKFAAALAKDPISTVREFLALQCLGAEDSRTTIRQLLKQLKEHGKPSQTGLEQGTLLLNQCDLRNAYASAEAHCTLILGEQDQLVPKSVRPALMALNPNTKTHLLKRAGHAPHLSHPKQTAQIICDEFSR